jgi:hypothetical protein
MHQMFFFQVYTSSKAPNDAPSPFENTHTNKKKMATVVRKPNKRPTDANVDVAKKARTAHTNQDVFGSLPADALCLVLEFTHWLHDVFALRCVSVHYYVTATKWLKNPMILARQRIRVRLGYEKDFHHTLYHYAQRGSRTPDHWLSLVQHLTLHHAARDCHDVFCVPVNLRTAYLMNDDSSIRFEGVYSALHTLVLQDVSLARTRLASGHDVSVECRWRYHSPSFPSLQHLSVLNAKDHGKMASIIVLSAPKLDHLEVVDRDFDESSHFNNFFEPAIRTVLYHLRKALEKRPESQRRLSTLSFSYPARIGIMNIGVIDYDFIYSTFKHVTLCTQNDLEAMYDHFRRPPHWIRDLDTVFADSPRIHVVRVHKGALCANITLNQEELRRKDSFDSHMQFIPQFFRNVVAYSICSVDYYRNHLFAKSYSVRFGDLNEARIEPTYEIERSKDLQC